MDTCIAHRAGDIMRLERTRHKRAVRINQLFTAGNDDFVEITGTRVTPCRVIAGMCI